MIEINENKKSRICIVDDKSGRIYDRDEIKAKFSIQDNNRTLKIFVNHPKSNKESTITKVPILAPQSTERYANANPKNIVPTSLISQIGFHSIIAEIVLNQNKLIPKICTIFNISKCSGLIHS